MTKKYTYTISVLNHYWSIEEIKIAATYQGQ